MPNRVTQMYPALKRWNREAGRKPSTDLLKQAQTTARPGSKDAFAIAMTLRPAGATQKQIAVVLGGPHRNKITQLVTRGVAKRVPAPSKDGHMVYRLSLKR